MKNLIVLIVVFISLAACAPSQGAVQTAIAQTQAAFVPKETSTPSAAEKAQAYAVETATAAALIPTIAPTETPAAFERFTVAQAQAALTSAGVEFADPKPMTKDDYGMAPMSAKEAVHFLVPSICSDCGGRLYSFSNPEDLALMQDYYVNAGKQSAMFFSWVFVKDNILVQVNGDLPEEKAKQYDAALQSMK